MIRLDEYEIFEKHKASLKETSKDANHNAYMSDSLREVVNFDSVKTEYVKNLGLATVPQSSDALLETSTNRILFVEFKNGHFKSHEVRKKVYDSVLIFSDITSTRISDLRRFAEYVFVYNRDMVCSDASKDATIQDSASLECIEDEVSKHAGKEIISFGMSIFKNYCFKDVHTYTKEQFNKFLQKFKIKED